MTIERAVKSGTSPKGPVSNSALVVGGGVAGMQAALDMADMGTKVYLLEQSSSIGGRMAMIDKTFPTLDCSACILTPRLSEVSRHPNIELLTYSELQKVEGKAGNFKVNVLKRSKFVDDDKCSGCGDCVPVCPVEVPNEFDQNLGFRKAIYVPFPQATPNTHTVTKRGQAACKIACPAHVNPQGFMALMREGKYDLALKLVRDAIPFPGSLGRVCPGLCEEECERQLIDESLSIRNLHRWLADYELENSSPEFKPIEVDKTEKIAVVGAGPAGIACAEKLVKLGYPVTVFEAKPEAGGLLRYGIPEYRLPRNILKEEIDIVEKIGVKFEFGKKIDSVKALQNKGYKAVFIGTGAPISSKLRISGEDAEGVFHAIDFLDSVNSGEKVIIGKHVAVIGGGNAAIDAARVAKRLGARHVTIIYRRSRTEMPAIKAEIDDAEAEGIELMILANPTEVITSRNQVVGIRCIKMELGEPDESGRRRPIPIRGSEFAIPLDNIIVAIGQRVDPKGPHSEVEVTEWGTPAVDSVSLETSVEGVFAGGDVVTGGGLVVSAVGAGHEAAESIHRYLRGIDIKEGRPTLFHPIPSEDIDKTHYEVRSRAHMDKLDLTRSARSFDEVEKGFKEDVALAESDRCIGCGVCCECEQCVEACTREAIDHSMTDEIVELNVGAIVIATGYKLFDVAEYPRFGYEKYANVIQAMEYERLINAAGPTHGHLIRLSDGKIPKSIGFIQCVGARDVAKGVPSCSRVCCMYGIKNAVMAKEHYPDVDVTIYYADIRAFGKGFEEFLEMAKTRFGVKFVRGRVAEVVEDPKDFDILLRVEDTENLEFLEIEHDMVILSPGIQPSPGLENIAENLGITLDEDGYIEVGHQTLNPVDSTTDGIFVCGCADGPKDIPDSVAAGSAAAMRATIVLTREDDK
ncbi:MAG: FAD-dependent oxidoreductase [Candidatus Thorarchaeota archaeon]|jgi:heterodisulfide reductase subunit A